MIIIRWVKVNTAFPNDFISGSILYSSGLQFSALFLDKSTT